MGTPGKIALQYLKTRQGVSGMESDYNQLKLNEKKDISEFANFEQTRDL
jgi:hypothetical protein